MKEKDPRDDYRLDTLTELFLAWIAVMLTIIAIGTILYYVVH